MPRNMLAALFLVVALALGVYAATDGHQPLRQAGDPALGLYTASPSTLATGEYDPLRLTAAGLLRVSVDAQTAGTTVQEVVGDAADGAAVSGNPVLIGGQDGTNAQSLRTNTTGNLEIAGDIADDAADAGNPLKIGGKAITGVTATAVAANDRVDAHYDVYGRQVTRPSGSWQVQHTPAANTQATIGQTADISGVKNVCTSITCTFSGNASSAAAVGTVFNLRDGASGAGTILWSGTIWLTATAGDSKSVTLGGLWIEGTAATAMTLEAAAAGGANTVQTVAMTGTITQ